MKKIMLIVIILLVDNTYAEVSRNYVVEDEMDDEVTYVTRLDSDNYGKYRHKGKANIAFQCSKGKLSFYATFPDYMGKPSQLTARFDKNKKRDMFQIQGTASKKGIAALGNTKWFKDNALKSSKLVLRGYNFNYKSDAAYKFDLRGIKSKLEETLTKGGCSPKLKPGEPNKETTEDKDWERARSAFR